MKWTKLPSYDEYTPRLLKQCESIKGIHKITNGLEIAYYMLLHDIKNQRKRKHGKCYNITKVSG